MLYPMVREVLFALSRDDAEIAHHLGIGALNTLERIPGALALIRDIQSTGTPKQVAVAGITFPNRLGLAAGCDKHAEALLAFEAMGFGFIEVGTVLPRPQEGNPRPRLFRLPEHHSLINRMGFNSHGADVVKGRLDRYHQMGGLRIPIGLSLGMMKDTPLEHAAADYTQTLRTLGRHGDYLVANISSPNTPGLRELQGGRYLERLIATIVNEEAQYLVPRPLFIKIAPDNMDETAHDAVLEAMDRGGAAGIIVGNTTVHRPAKLKDHRFGLEAGGLSGTHLFVGMLELVNRSAREAPGFAIIAVGGISNEKCATIALDYGADLVQIYTSLIYKGPKLVRDIRQVI